MTLKKNLTIKKKNPDRLDKYDQRKYATKKKELGNFRCW